MTDFKINCLKLGIERSRADKERNLEFLIIENKNKSSSRRVSKHFLSILISIMVNRWLQVILLVPEKSICIKLILIIVLQYSFQNLLKVSTRLFVLSGQKSDFGFLRESTKIIPVPNIKYFFWVSVDILTTLGCRKMKRGNSALSSYMIFKDFYYIIRFFFN